MIEACKQFLFDRLAEVVKTDGNPAFTGASQGNPGNVFFGPMPRDFLKNNQYAACCLVLQDEKKKNGRLMSNTLNADKTEFIRYYRTFVRQVLYRVILYAADFKDQWGESEFKGFIDQLEANTANHKIIADELSMAVGVELFDSIRPWDQEEARQAIRRRSHKAIARINFTGGIYMIVTIPAIRDVEIEPSYQ